jgi:integrase
MPTVWESAIQHQRNESARARLSRDCASELSRLAQQSRRTTCLRHSHRNLPSAARRSTISLPDSIPQNISRAGDQLGERCRGKQGCPGLRFHDLRHCAITHLPKAARPTRPSWQLQGHVSRRMLERYSQVRMEAKRRAMEGLAVSTKLAGYDTNHGRKQPSCLNC